MSGSDAAWRECFSSDKYLSKCHMDSGKVGDYFTMNFATKKSFNGFRFECGGNNDGRGIKQNVFDIQFYDDAKAAWVTAGTTDTASGICGRTDSSGYAQWKTAHASTKWRFLLKKQYGGPWYHGFAWYKSTDVGFGKGKYQVTDDSHLVRSLATDKGRKLPWSAVFNDTNRMSQFLANVGPVRKPHLPTSRATILSAEDAWNP